jgi:hypothetical protein
VEESISMKMMKLLIAIAAIALTLFFLLPNLSWGNANAAIHQTE